jgi:glycosyltransferase involved in cell wall biosynthesis
MITIFIIYQNRSESLKWTLRSLLKYDPKDFNVLIIDDNSREDIILPGLPFKVRVIKFTTEPWTDIYTCVLNMGFFYALDGDPDIIIMQHAECYHQGDILNYAKRVTDDSYISFGCYALGKDDTPESFEIIDRPCTQDGQRSWYNHPIIRPVGFNFCSAITAKNLVKLNGFDERFKDGCAYEDDYFLHQVKILGLKVEITADPIVFHQYHLVSLSVSLEARKRRSEEAWVRNQTLFKTLSQSKEYRAKHLLTPNL